MIETNMQSLTLRFQGELEKVDDGHGNELNAILDGVNELCSKTLYLLKLK